MWLTVTAACACAAPLRLRPHRACAVRAHHTTFTKCHSELAEMHHSYRTLIQPTRGKLSLVYKTGFNVTCFFSLLSCIVQLSTIEWLRGIEAFIVMSRYLAVLWHHDISWYIETSLILVSKRRYSRYLSRYRRYRTTLLVIVYTELHPLSLAYSTRLWHRASCLWTLCVIRTRVERVERRHGTRHITLDCVDKLKWSQLLLLIGPLANTVA